VLVEELFGFRANLKTKTDMYELNNDTVSALNDKLFVLGIFCD
jgi:hypothetical protein